MLGIKVDKGFNIPQYIVILCLHYPNWPESVVIEYCVKPSLCCQYE